MWSPDLLTPFSTFAKNPRNEFDATCYRILSCLDALCTSDTVTIHKDGRITFSPNDKPVWDVLFLETSMVNILFYSNPELDLSLVTDTRTYKYQWLPIPGGHQLNWLTPKGRIKMEFHNAKLSARPHVIPNQPRPH